MKKIFDEDIEIRISYETVTRTLKKKGLIAVTKKKKSKLEERHIVICKQVQINLCGSDSIKYACKSPGQDLVVVEYSWEMLNIIQYCLEDEKYLLLQQDNAICHKKNYVKLIKFPPNSTDLNPIENLLWILKIKLYKDAKFRTKQQL
ncbi:Transposase family protein [Reticulomyxa filosa]|uniref:Transposase family protein n=1 Tax=Reticulomyxa filosa TaxID=46433 RepID=X6MQU9_RETFI|nr:Transposase family protein [Reticulomyxa filosa]|eukprot:ETO15455.1 Transposase family protein [Reticulomyxa filosa]